jgi:hypothetical protein
MSYSFTQSRISYFNHFFCFQELANVYGPSLHSYHAGYAMQMHRLIRSHTAMFGIRHFHTIH